MKPTRLNGQMPEKMKSFFRKLRGNYLLFAFLIPFLGMTGLMLIRQFQPFGKLSMLYSDAYHQYYPFFVEMRESILNGDGLLWSWSVGLGLDFLGLYAYYLASPLNWLSILVPKSMLLGYFSMLVPLKLGFAGLFFALLLKKLFGKNDRSIALFGAFYATCAWALGYLWNIMWVDSFALLPLVVLGMVSLLEKRKFVLYTLALFSAVIINYYVGFFVCIFLFLAFFCYEICYFKGFKRFFADLSLMGVFSLLAIMMTLIVELPAYAALQNTYSSVNAFPETFRLNMVTEHDLKGLFEALGKVAGNMNGGIAPTFKEGLPNLYCGVGTVALAFLFITAKGVKLREKLCSIAMLIFFMLSFAIRQLDYIWHGFHFTNMIPYRFSFLFSFVLLIMAYRAFLLWEQFKPRQIIIAALLSVCIIFCSEKRSEPIYLAFNLVLLVMYIAVLLYQVLPITALKNRRKPEQEKIKAEHRRLCTQTLAGVMAVELVLNLVNFGINFAATNVEYYPKGKEYTAAAIEYMQEREKDNLFYRAEATHTQSLNDGALNGYNGITTFTSSAFVNVTKFMQALGYGAKDNYNRYCYEEASPVANLFFSLKYMLERDGKVEENSYFDEVGRFESNDPKVQDVVLLENNAYLPLGFLANSELGALDFSGSDNRFTFQNQLVEAATGVGNVWSALSGSKLQITASGSVSLTGNTPNAGFCRYTANDAGYVTFSYKADKEGFFCVDINQSKRNNFTVKKNGLTLYNDSYSLPQMISVCDVKPGDEIDIVFTCKKGESGTITLDNGILDEALFRQAHGILNASTLALTEFGTTKIAGEISCNRDGLLYASIPQNGNWIATVDGEEVETVQVGGAMLAIPITEGQHTVILTYRSSAFNLGALTTGLSCAVFLSLWIVFYKPFKKKEQA